jgi:hypothetical protein
MCETVRLAFERRILKEKESGKYGGKVYSI